MSILYLAICISCNDDKSDDTNIENPEVDSNRYIVEISSNVTSSTENGTFDFTDFDNHFMVDENGKIEVWEIDFIDGITNVEFEIESNKIVKTTITDTYNTTQNSTPNETLVYYDEEGRIVRIESFSDGEKYQDYDLVYNGSSINFIDLINERDRSVTLDSENRITTFSEPSIDFTILFEYANGNLVRKTLNESSILTYEYDTKKNPFKTDSFLNFSKIIFYLNIISGWEFLFYDEHNIFNNTNNLTKFNVLNNDFGGLENQSYAFEYDLEDYPIKKTNVDKSISVDYIYNQK